MKERESIRRAQILKAAAECVAEEGIDGATLAKIARRAGLSTGLLAYYFKDKRDLILSMLQDHADALTEQTREAVGPQADMKRIGAWFDAWFGNEQTEHTFGNISLETWAHSTREPELREYNEERFLLGRESFARHIRAGISEGSIPEDTDPYLAAEMLMAMAVGLRVAATLYQDVLPDDRARQVARYALDLLTGNDAS
jgi:AcrR family transcriptional regulator